LKKAWEKGIVLSGPGAGAICWFEEGLFDSHPEKYTAVKGLYPTCVHCLFNYWLLFLLNN